jgi:hypothetical protein
MPSKSKAQAHLMAAAAHNPDITRDAGIDQSVAHDFNKADEKDGNLKKGSDLPSHVSEEVELDEASGVGIIKVPQTLLKQVQKYVGSVLLTMGVMKQHELVNQHKTEAAEALMNFLRRFQRKYGASVLAPDDLKKYINSSTHLNIDPDEIYNSLPENLKKNPRTKELINNLTIKMKMSNQFLHKGGSSAVRGTQNELDLGIPSYQDIKNTNIDGVAHSLNYSIGTVEHELQHTIQQVVNKNLNPKDQQAHQHPDYISGKDPDAYYRGGIEFGPQVKDLANFANEWLEENPDSITGNKNADISKAIQHVLRSYPQANIVKELRKYKEDARANKAMKLIYREVSNFYDNELHAEDNHEFDSTEKNIDDGHEFERDQEYPAPGDSLMGDLYLKVWQEFGEQPKIHGLSKNHDPEQFTLRVDGGYTPYDIVFRHGHRDDYFIIVKPDGGEKLRIDFTKEQMAKLPVNYLGNMRGINALQDMVEKENAPDANLEGMLFAVENINENSGFLNHDSSRKVQFDDYIQDEGFFIVLMADVKAKIVCQTSGKMYTVDIDDGENNFIGSEKEIEELFNKVFDAYYNPEVEPRHINKALLYSESITDFDESLAYYVERTAKRKERGEAAMAESSMRGLADIVQNAELEHDIEDADDQELINKGLLDEDSDEQEYDLQGKPVKPGQRSAPVNSGTSTERLEEMPLRYDSFMGMDPQVYVDKEAQANTPKNMTPVKDHGEWTTYRGHDGYMAYDNDTGEAIASVKGHVDEGWFNVDVTASSRSVKGVVYQMFMDIVKVEGTPILSGRLQSDDAIKFWQRLIQSHKVYVVANCEVLQAATPEKFHKYWSDEEGSPQSQFQLLLVK